MLALAFSCSKKSQLQLQALKLFFYVLLVARTTHLHEKRSRKLPIEYIRNFLAIDDTAAIFILKNILSFS